MVAITILAVLSFCAPNQKDSRPILVSTTVTDGAAIPAELAIVHSTDQTDRVVWSDIELDAPTPTPQPKPSLTISQDEVRRLFGSFSYSSRGGGRVSIDDKDWLKNIITLTVPFNGSTQRMQIHRRVAQTVHQIFEEIETTNADRGYAYKLVFDGSFVPRQMASGTGALSNHTWGIAIDLNAKTNPMTYGRGRHDMPSWVIEVFRNHGFRWGGDWTNPYDPMHFEYSLPDPMTLAESTLDISVQGNADLTVIQPDGQRLEAPLDRVGKTDSVWLKEAPPGTYVAELRFRKADKCELLTSGYTSDGQGASITRSVQGKPGQIASYNFTWNGRAITSLTPAPFPNGTVRP